MELSELQFQKALFSIAVTPSGMLIDVRLLQLKNVYSLILVTFLGILMDVSPLQHLYLQPIITQYFIDNKSEIWLLFLIAHSKR